MIARTSHHIAPIFLMLIAVLLLAACQPAAPTAPVAIPQPSQPPAQPTEPIGEIQTGVSLDYSAVAQICHPGNHATKRPPRMDPTGKARLNSKD